MGDGVLGELGQRLVDPLALLVELALQLPTSSTRPAKDLAPAGHDGAAVDRHAVAIAEQLEGIALLDVEQRHPGLREQQRPGVGVAPVGGGRGVDHRAHPGRDQLLGGDPVDVDVVDDRDVAGSKALDQVLGPAPEPRRALDRRVGGRPLRRESRAGRRRRLEVATEAG